MTDRAHVYTVLQNPDGSVVLGASVRVLNSDLSTVSASLFTTDAGSTTKSKPFTSTDGVVEFYLDTPLRGVIGYTPVGASEQFRTFDAYYYPSVPPVPTSGSIMGTPVTTSTNYTVAAGVFAVLVNGTATITLPSPTSDATHRSVKNIGTGTVTVTAPGGALIDGAASLTMSVQYSSLDFICDGTNYFTV